MSIFLVLIYSATTFAFIPLFTYLMIKMKQSYNALYKEIKRKLICVFVFFVFFLLMRLVIYIDQRFTHVIQEMETITIQTEIPFYVSEIFITVVLCYVMFQVTTLSKSADLNRKQSNPSLNSPEAETSRRKLTAAE